MSWNFNKLDKPQWPCHRFLIYYSGLGCDTLQCLYEIHVFLMLWSPFVIHGLQEDWSSFSLIMFTILNNFISICVYVYIYVFRVLIFFKAYRILHIPLNLIRISISILCGYEFTREFRLSHIDFHIYCVTVINHKGLSKPSWMLIM